MTVKDTYKEMLAVAAVQEAFAKCRTYRSFDAYVAEHPEGESYRRWITNDGRLAADGLLIFSGEGTHSGIPGGFLWAVLAIHYVQGEGNKYVPNGKWYVHVHDCDDGLLVKEFDNKEAAIDGMAEIEGYAPITFRELVTVLGYSVEN